MALTKIKTGSVSDSITLTTPDINGGTIDATVIGGTTPAVATFTTASDASGNVRSGRKNLILNGNLAIAQRGMATGVGSVTVTYTADRWKLAMGGVTPRFTVTQNTGPSGAGKSLKYQVTTTDDVSTSSDYAQITQDIEGLSLQGLEKGTATAKPLTVSFYVKAKLTGVYAINIWDGGNGRQNTSDYTVLVADTWEKKTVVFGADTTGLIDNDNTTGLALNFILAAGTIYTGGSNGISVHGSSATSYAANHAVNVLASTANYFELAEVQLEVGSVATDFEHRSYGEELALCQRYYEVISHSQRGHGSGGDAFAGSSLCFKQTKRATPTLAFVSYGSVRATLTYHSTYSASKEGAGVQFGNAASTESYAYGTTFTAAAEL